MPWRCRKCTLVLLHLRADEYSLGMSMKSTNDQCKYYNSQPRSNAATGYAYYTDPACALSESQRVAMVSGGWGGFNSSIRVAELPADQLKNEFISFCM